MMESWLFSETKLRTKFDTISKNSASASEDIILYSKKLFDNVYSVGMNTSGAILYGNILHYRLKNSGWILTVAQKEWFYDNGLEEGTGIMPDYVISGSFKDTIKFLTNDKEMVTKLSNLN